MGELALRSLSVEPLFVSTRSAFALPAATDLHPPIGRQRTAMDARKLLTVKRDALNLRLR